MKRRRRARQQPAPAFHPVLTLEMNMTEAEEKEIWAALAEPAWDYDACWGDGCHLTLGEDEHGNKTFDLYVRRVSDSPPIDDPLPDEPDLSTPGVIFSEMRLADLKRIRALLNVALARFGE
jgi:hypothetical protein